MLPLRFLLRRSKWLRLVVGHVNLEYLCVRAQLAQYLVRRDPELPSVWPDVRALRIRLVFGLLGAPGPALCHRKQHGADFRIRGGSHCLQAMGRVLLPRCMHGTSVP